jgi:glycosyltransferase involved in cell wall biosynthesis
MVLLGRFLRRLGNKHDARDRPRPVQGDAPRPIRASAGMPGEFIAFVVGAGQQAAVVSPGAKLYTPLASTRLRVLIPAAELASRFPVLLVPLELFVADPDLESIGTARGIVLGKLSTNQLLARPEFFSGMLDKIAARSSRAPLFADISDDYAAMGEALGKPFLGEYQRRVLELFRIVVPCAALRDSFATRSRFEASVIEDPFESDESPPSRVAREHGDRLNLTWFGGLAQINRPGLSAAFRALAGEFRSHPTDLEMVGNADARSLAEHIATEIRAVAPQWTLRYTVWSLEATRAAIDRSDFVVLPQETGTSWGRVKSHNRLVETIRRGRLALAAPIPSYRELERHAWVGEPFADGLRWALANPDAAIERVTTGQRYVAERFAPATIARKWANLLGV